ncbi:MAG: hypothetical protein JSV99_10945, partial [Planctomycetota bacterium]
SNWTVGQNKPNQTQYKANTNPTFPDAQMNVTSSLTKPYENAPLRPRDKNKPNQTQFQNPHFPFSPLALLIETPAPPKIPRQIPPRASIIIRIIYTPQVPGTQF